LENGANEPKESPVPAGTRSDWEREGKRCERTHRAADCNDFNECAVEAFTRRAITIGESARTFGAEEKIGANEPSAVRSGNPAAAENGANEPNIPRSAAILIIEQLESGGSSSSPDLEAR
jgi:hypothetical protein